ncbi:MAG TPA: isoamylase early set domain-containing protein [Gemmatimonadaceae bacterium]|jgi:1,4-alpha-glucan branching enzyme
MPERELDTDRARRLDPAIEALRIDVPVRSAWRESVLREVEALPTPRRSRLSLVRNGNPVPTKTERGPWWRSPWTTAAIAAALLVMASVLVYRASARQTPDSVAESSPHPSIDAAAATHAAAVRIEERFSIAAPGAGQVSLVGDFNQWHPGVTPLRPMGDGRTWEIELALPPGRHVYAFVVDGKIVPDPAAPRAAEDDFGIPNSVAIIAVSN